MFTQALQVKAAAGVYPRSRLWRTGLTDETLPSFFVDPHLLMPQALRDKIGTVERRGVIPKPWYDIDGGNEISSLSAGKRRPVELLRHRHERHTCDVLHHGNQ
jgi:hypothetical protein